MRNPRSHFLLGKLSWLTCEHRSCNGCFYPVSSVLSIHPVAQWKLYYLPRFNLIALATAAVLIELLQEISDAALMVMMWVKRDVEIKTFMPQFILDFRL